jgi:hypothetical protein
MSQIGSASITCGTREQTLEKLFELLGRGIQELSVTDLKGRTWTADEFSAPWICALLYGGYPLLERWLEPFR